MEKLTHWKSTRENVQFMQSADLAVGADEHDKPIYASIILTISNVDEEKVIDPKTNKEKQKTVMHFSEEGAKPLVLNTTNKKSTEKATGTPFVEKWIGKRIKIYVECGIKAFGELVDALRITPAPVSMKKCECCGKEISESVFNATKEKCGFGVCSAACRDKLLAE